MLTGITHLEVEPLQQMELPSLIHLSNPQGHQWTHEKPDNTRSALPSSSPDKNDPPLNQCHLHLMPRPELCLQKIKFINGKNLSIITFSKAFLKKRRLDWLIVSHSGWIKSTSPSLKETLSTIPNPVVHLSSFPNKPRLQGAELMPQISISPSKVQGNLVQYLMSPHCILVKCSQTWNEHKEFSLSESSEMCPQEVLHCPLSPKGDK